LNILRLLSKKDILRFGLTARTSCLQPPRQTSLILRLTFWKYVMKTTCAETGKVATVTYVGYDSLPTIYSKLTVGSECTFWPVDVST
jgi:hypothetical protein